MKFCGGKSLTWMSCLVVLLVTLANAEHRHTRQADFDFPGPRRAPAFGSDGGGGGGRHRSRPPSFRLPPPELGGSGEGGGGDENGGGGLDDLGGGGFRPLPPPRSFRPPPSERPAPSSTGVGGGRFSSRPSFTSDGSNEADFGGSQKGGKGATEEELAEEEKKPDRLTLLLQESKFQCSEKKPGYYADDGLSCEVFHYCNEGVRHSWMCPAGTAFHQIHLICMAEGGDNICKQSNKYHFVNDYLYKALPDSSRNPNGTIRYADRYFPDEAQGGGGGDGGEEIQQAPKQQHSRPSFNQGGSGEQEEQFFAPPPSRPSSGGRFRPQFDDNQFLLPPPNFSPGDGGRDDQGHRGGGGGGGGGGSRGSGEDLGAFGTEEIRFQPPSSLRSSSGRPRAQQLPRFRP